MSIPDNVMYKEHVTLILVTLLALDGLANITIIEKGILPLTKNSVGIKLFVDIVNEDRERTYEVIPSVKKCCLYDTELEDCDVINIYGNPPETIRPKDRKTLIYVYPTLYQHDLVGYCDIIYNKYRKHKIQLRIPFDTRIKIRNFDLKNYIHEQKWKACESLDLDPLDNCFPVNCDLKYNGKKSFFDIKTNKCREPLVCLEDVANEVPTVIYIPDSNTCSVRDDLLTVQDIYNINTGNTLKRSVKSGPKVEVKSNCTTISQYIYYIRDLINGKLYPYDNSCKSVTKFATCHVIMSIISACAMIFSMLCCLNLSMWIYTQLNNKSINDCKEILRRKLRKRFGKNSNSSVRQIRNALLREVMYRDIPMEMRHSFISICERIDEEVRRKKRYRNLDTDSEISLNRERDNSLSATTTKAD